MPCRDDNAEAAETADRCRNAMAALLCGVLRDDPVAMFHAGKWYARHGQIDALRKAVKWDWQDPRIAELQADVERVLLEVHEKLCK